MKKITIISALLLVFISCRKPNDDVTAITKENIAGTYRLTGLKARVSGFPEVDLYNNSEHIEPCEKDNLLKFNLNGIYQLVDAGVVCDPSSDYESTWSVNGNNLIVDGESSTIESFDGKKLVLSYEDEINPEDVGAPEGSPPFAAKISVTLTKQ